MLCRDTNEIRAHVIMTARLDSDTARDVVVRTIVDGEVLAESDRRLACGTNEVKWGLDIADPSLWWPRALGEQPLTSIAVEIVADGVVSDRRERRTGLRQVAWNNWSCSVNGERLFLKGANLLPTRAGLADATPDEMRRDVELAVEAGLDAVRVHGHIAPREIYEAADELGIVVLQDFPLQWGYSRSVRTSAMRQAEAAVDQLGHHPSIVQWNAHNDPVAAAIGIEGDTFRTRVRYLAAQQLPSWNKSVLDRWVRRSFEHADPTRLVVPHSGVLPHFPKLDGTDSHLYFGWYHGDARDIERLAAAVPRLVRFVSEFGAQAVPDNHDFIDETQWPDLDWDLLGRKHGLQKWVFDQRVPPDQFDSFEAWKRATQVYQAELVKHHIELLRRIKYRPAGGFCVFSLNDPEPVVSWSVLDHERAPKLAWKALVAGCRPVVVVADRPPDIVAPGETIALDVHVVNDLREPIEQAEITITAKWAGGSRQWRYGGEIAADEVGFVGNVALAVPDTLGALTFDIVLESPAHHAQNHYSSVITAIPA